MLYALSLTPDLVFMLIFAALIVGFVLVLWLSVRRSKKNRGIPDGVGTAEEEADGLTDAPDTEETPYGGDSGDIVDGDDAWMPPEPEAYPARVVEMRVVTGNVGSNKRPRTEVSFLVTFLTDDGERVEYPVPEELYVTLDIDRTGTLVILNGGFFDFGSGEETDGEAEAAE